MSSRAALLSVFLAGPALAAPPVSAAPIAPQSLSPKADNAAILTAISDGDPGLTESPSPVERVLEAAQLAERRLAAAADLDAAAELLTLAGMAREVAYRRTKAAEHLCALITDADIVLLRPNLPSAASKEADDFRDRARRTLATEHPQTSCATVERPTPPVPRAEPQPDSPRPAPVTVRKKPSAATIAGGVVLGVAGLSAVAFAGVQIYRAQAASELKRVRDDVRDAGGKTEAQVQEIERLRGIERRTEMATTGLGVSLGVLAALGVGLTIWGRQSAQNRRARLLPQGGPREVGLAIVGSF